MTLQEAKEIVSKKNHDVAYAVFYLISGFPDIIKINDEAAELYARSKWDEACEAQMEEVYGHNCLCPCVVEYNSVN